MGVFFEDKNGSNALLPSSWLAGDHFAQQVPDGSVNNYVPIPYNSISGFSASARSVTKRHHSARNHAKKRKSSIATKKRKREDKVDRMKLFSSRVARKKNQSTRNENNSKSTKRRKKSRKAGGSSSNTTVDLIGMYIPPNRATFAPPMGAPQPMGAPKHSKIPPFTFSNVTATNPFRKQSIPAPIPTRGYKRMSEYPGPIPFGNPSIMQGTLATMYGSPPQNMPYPPPRPCANDQPTYPYVRFQPQVQGFPGDKRKRNNMVYKPVCQEFPLAMGCGRQYRLQRQELAKSEGLLPLLKVMFCCCCNDEIEVPEESER